VSWRFVGAGHNFVRWIRALYLAMVQVFGWLDCGGVLPLIEGTVIRLEVSHLPSGAIPKASVVVVLRCGCHRRGRGPVVAGVSAPR